MKTAETSTFPGTFDSLSAIGEFVTRAAKAAGLDVRAVYEVAMAVDEACSNIIEHGYDPLPVIAELGVAILAEVKTRWRRPRPHHRLAAKPRSNPPTRLPLDPVGLPLDVIPWREPLQE